MKKPLTIKLKDDQFNKLHEIRKNLNISITKQIENSLEYYFDNFKDIIISKIK